MTNAPTPLPQQAAQDEREKFEAHIQSVFPTVLPNVLLLRSSNGKYGSMVVHHAWMAWSAALSHSEQDRADAERYRVIRPHIEPAVLAERLRLPCSDLPDGESIEHRIDSLCDAARQQEGKS